MYKDIIRHKFGSIPPSILDLQRPNEIAKAPSRASSEFTTNNAQGVWAEDVFIQAFNNAFTDYRAVKYGRSDDIVAGENGFEQHWETFKNEVEEFGKRPDVLIFKLSDYLEEYGTDISMLNINDTREYVSSAHCSVEIRSSAMLVNRYERWAMNRSSDALALFKETIDDIRRSNSEYLSEKSFELSYFLNEEGHLDFPIRIPVWKDAQGRLIKEKLSIAREQQKIYNDRKSLSITVKVEDLKVVYKWIQEFNIPQFYFQVFFDKIYGLSFESVLDRVKEYALDGRSATIKVEGDVKNQNKLSFKIPVNLALLLTDNVVMPEHYSKLKELTRGNLLYYVAFRSGMASLNTNNISSLLNL